MSSHGLRRVGSGVFERRDGALMVLCMVVDETIWVGKDDLLVTESVVFADRRGGSKESPAAPATECRVRHINLNLVVAAQEAGVGGCLCPAYDRCG